ncbi:tRNA (guanine(37)-N1)-methyltransferase 1 [Dendrobium catenatum]|uniref:tRNA (Guanine(37)-N1)-methyltransferase 1 n=1 Tax=Dendrobium catenatum TaxID=906689 RepID=A0A2I0VD75_9ASPA|nr:tRNA (guanine(37)-N1)-methyltransferase 1 [Dendrobium catenatum]
MALAQEKLLHLESRRGELSEFIVYFEILGPARSEPDRQNRPTKTETLLGQLGIRLFRPFREASDCPARRRKEFHRTCAAFHFVDIMEERVILDESKFDVKLNLLAIQIPREFSKSVSRLLNGYPPGLSFSHLLFKLYKSVCFP